MVPKTDKSMVSSRGITLNGECQANASVLAIRVQDQILLDRSQGANHQVERSPRTVHGIKPLEYTFSYDTEHRARSKYIKAWLFKGLLFIGFYTYALYSQA